MQKIPKYQVLKRLGYENSWWAEPFSIPSHYAKWTPRPYLERFFPLVQKTSQVRRAIVLLGPRRVGKTVLVHHVIGRLLKQNVRPAQIGYCSVDNPIYTGLPLENLLELYSESSGNDFRKQATYFFFDEIQYHRDWEIHLKALVDNYPTLNLIVSGSAAAALKLKSNESGAGRFTEFLLPPLTFHEYLSLLASAGKAIPEIDSKEEAPGVSQFTARNLQQLNDAFLDYLNFGGYPELVLTPQIQEDPARFVKADIIDKVLLRDLPSLYGIQDIQELYLLFTTLSLNTASEVRLEELSQGSGVAKNTIKRYIEYLEAAMLIRTVTRVDFNARHFKRAHFFKVYLTNPSIHSALFSPVTANDPVVGHLAETAVFSQWFHAAHSNLHYARWPEGEIDIVNLSRDQKVLWVAEVKWSDSFLQETQKLKRIVQFCREHNVSHALITTRSKRENVVYDNINFELIPVSEYCYTVGHNLVVRPWEKLFPQP